eukprot:g2304.t1
MSANNVHLGMLPVLERRAILAKRYRKKARETHLRVQDGIRKRKQEKNNKKEEANKDYSWSSVSDDIEDTADRVFMLYQKRNSVSETTFRSLRSRLQSRFKKQISALKVKREQFQKLTDDQRQMIFEDYSGKIERAAMADDSMQQFIMFLEKELKKELDVFEVEVTKTVDYFTEKIADHAKILKQFEARMQHDYDMLRRLQKQYLSACLHKAKTKKEKIHIAQSVYEQIGHNYININHLGLRGEIASAPNFCYSEKPLSLCFRSNYLRDLECKIFLESCQECKAHILHLDFGDNKFASNGLDALLTACSKTTRRLSLDDNNLGDYCSTVFAQHWLGDFSVPLIELNLSKNNLGPQCAKTIGLLLRQPEVSLKVLNLNWNTIGDKGCSSLLANGTCSLAKLFLEGNGLSDESADRIYEILQSSKKSNNLKELCLSYNCFTEYGISNLTRCQKKRISTTHIVLHGTKLKTMEEEKSGEKIAERSYSTDYFTHVSDLILQVQSYEKIQRRLVTEGSSDNVNEKGYRDESKFDQDDSESEVDHENLSVDRKNIGTVMKSCNSTDTRKKDVEMSTSWASLLQFESSNADHENLNSNDENFTTDAGKMESKNAEMNEEKDSTETNEIEKKYLTVDVARVTLKSKGKIYRDILLPASLLNFRLKEGVESNFVLCETLSKDNCVFTHSDHGQAVFIYSCTGFEKPVFIEFGLPMIDQLLLAKCGSSFILKLEKR